MRFHARMRGLVQAIAVVLSLALPMVLAVSVGRRPRRRRRAVRARAARGPSRRRRSTSTAPGTAQPFNRTITQPGSPSVGAPAAALNRRRLLQPAGGGLLGGLAAGFLGAGLLGMLFGGGMFCGLGGIVVDPRPDPADRPDRHRGAAGDVVVAAPPRRRGRPMPAGPGEAPSPGASSSFRSGMGFGLGSRQRAARDRPADYEAFERLLGEIQAAWSNEDVARLHTLATPEMVSYFTSDLEQNRARNRINKVSGIKLLQGDLAEAWREGDTDYASVAMRFSLVDKTLDRATGRLVEGSEQPTEVTEVWTFLRPRGGNWELSAIQQTN